MTVQGPGDGNTSTVSGEVTVRIPVQAGFSTSSAQVVTGDEVGFADESTGDITSWLWDFGDGQTSDVPNPTHSYDTADTYTVSLTGQGPGNGNISTAEKDIQVWNRVQAGFSASSDKVPIDEEVSFADESTGDITSWLWDFGDGQTSDISSPTHSYDTADTYTVSLTGQGPGDGNISTAEKVIQVTSPPRISPSISDVTTQEDTAISLNLTDHEIDDFDSGLTLRWNAQLLQGADLLESYNTDGGDDDLFTFTPRPNISGDVQVLFTLTDTDGDTADQEVLLRWEPLPDPPEISLLSPGDGAVDLPTSLALTWEGIDPDPGEVLIYDVQLGRADPPDSLVASGQTSISVLLSDLLEQQTYFWRVTVTDASGLVDISSVRSFTTVPDRKAPVIVLGPSAVGVTDNQATVQWSTDEAGTSQAEYSLQPDLADAQPFGSQDLLTQHALMLVDLLSDTTYYYRVSSTDAASNPSQPKSGQFKTLAAPDTLEPQILSGPVATGITDNQATVQWSTDEAGTSVVEYGLTQGLGLFRQLLQPVADHAVILTGLEADTTYYYRVYSIDPSQNTSLHKLGTFTTLAAPDTMAPQILTGPTTTGLTDQSVTLRWTTNEISDSYVRFSLQSDLAEASTRELGDPLLTHSVTLTNLLSDTTYFYQVRSTDVSDNPSLFRQGQFTTLAAPDTIAPQILIGPVATGITDKSARIEWTTNEDADARIDFGIDALDQVIQRADRLSKHNVALTNLLPDTTYLYQLTLSDLNANQTHSASFSFTTLAAPDTTAPIILEGPVVTTRLHDQAIIEWVTDEESDSQVAFGLTSAYEDVVTVMADVKKHAIRLTNLLSDTTYFYQVRSTDASDNGPVYKSGTFTTLAAPDAIPPQILTGPTTTGLTDQSVTLRWTTNEISDSYVRFSLQSDLAEASTRELGDPLLTHSVTLTNLLSDTTYFYQVRSTDVSDNPSLFRQGQFTTLAAPDTIAPQILIGPVATGITDKSARIEWTTNEDADARIDFGIDALDQVIQRADRLSKHNVALTNLLPDTTYLYQLTLSDLNANQTHSASFSFTTLAAPDTTAPIILEGPVVTTRLHDQAIIEWVTDEESDSQVAFGLTSAYEDVVTVMADVKKHAIRLTNLIAATPYHYQVRSTDASDNGPALSADFTFTTLAAPDTIPPQITAAPIVLKRTDRSATIAWSTDELADGFVEYGLDSSYGLVTGSAEHDRLHEVQLTNLKPATTYHYRVLSTDPVDNGPTASVGDLTFFTKAAPDTLPPVIVSDPFVTARKQTAATIQWVTDEPSDSRLNFGLDASYGQESILPEDVLVHTVDLSNLLPDTEYHFRAGSVDAADNNPTFSDDLTFRTLALPDTLEPLLLSGPTVRNITSTSASIEWVTDEPSNSIVDYGTTLFYEIGHLERGNRVTVHVVSIANLTPSTTYHLKISSTDGTNNTLTTDWHGTRAHSQDQTFRTLAAADNHPPVFLEGPLVYARDQAAAVEWRTDEAGRYEIIIDSRPTMDGAQREVLQSNELKEKHAVELTNLQPGTFYYYRLTVWDQAGNARVATTVGAGGARSKVAAKLAQPPGGAGSFVTRLEPDTQFPVLLSPPQVTARTSSSLTIEWETDERSDSFIEFGSVENLGLTLGSPDDVIHHRVVLTNLQPGQSYQYLSASTDPSGNGSTKSAKLVASTDLELDLTPPRIETSPKIVWLTDQSATIEWTTDEVSTSVVEYGSDDLNGRREHAELTRQHRITLTNLTPVTSYQYRVSSVDGSNNGPASSDERTFQTESVPDRDPPQIVSGPNVVSQTDQTATIVWETNELADSFIEYGTEQGLLEMLVGSAENVLEHRMTLTNLEAATTHFLKVGSVDRSNNGPVESEEFQFTTEAVADTLPPAVPTGVTLQAGSEATWLTWNPNAEPDFAGYNLYRRAVSGESFQLVASLLLDPNFLDRGLANGVTYAYQISAVDNALSPNESDLSPLAEGVPSSDNVPGAPSVPLSSSSGEATTLTIRNASSVAGRDTLTYTFQVSTDPMFTDVVARAGRIPEGPGEITEWAFTRPLDSTLEYWWRTRANDGLFDGPWMEPTTIDINLILLTGDFNGDFVVNFNDFFLFADHFGIEQGEVGWDPIFDLSKNGLIDFDDFFLFADHFGEKREAAKPSVVADAAGKIQAQLRLLHITPRSAVLALDIERDKELKGYGIVLRHIPGVDFQRAPPDVRIRTAGKIRLLEGLLRKTPERSWFGIYPLEGEFPGERVFEVSFDLFPEAIGSEVVLEELWAIDAEQRSYRLLEGARVSLTPQAFKLAPPYPNPFNPTVHIDYGLPERTAVRLQVYNILGQRIRTLVDDVQKPGFYQFSWSGVDDSGLAAATGVYLIRLEAGSFLTTRKVLMLR